MYALTLFAHTRHFFLSRRPALVEYTFKLSVNYLNEETTFLSAVRRSHPSGYDAILHRTWKNPSLYFIEMSVNTVPGRYALSCLTDFSLWFTVVL